MGCRELQLNNFFHFSGDNVSSHKVTEVDEEKNGNGFNHPCKFVFIRDDVLAQHVTQESGVGGTAAYLLYDGHGSTRLLTHTSSSIANRFDYDACGKNLFSASVTNPSGTDMLYSGEQFDPNLQMQYLRARYYDQNNGTFNRVDPFNGNMGDPQSLHKYGYCHNDPVNGIDPTGMFSLVELVTNMATQTIMSSMLGTVLGPIQNAIGSKLIPPHIIGTLSEMLLPSAYMIGLGGNVGHAVIRATVGVEVLVSPHTWKGAVYGYAGASFHGTFGSGLGWTAQMSLGLVWHVKSSHDYKGPFANFTISYSKLPQRIKTKVLHHLIRMVSSKSLILENMPDKWVDYVQKYNLNVIERSHNKILSILDRISISFFWSPRNPLSGAKGISVNLGGFGYHDTSTIGFSLTNYWQLYPENSKKFME